MSQNELALQFYNAGFFDPGNAAQALACLEMMDFDGKSMVMGRLRERMQAVARPFEEDTASALPPTYTVSRSTFLFLCSQALASTSPHLLHTPFV